MNLIIEKARTMLRISWLLLIQPRTAWKELAGSPMPAKASWVHLGCWASAGVLSSVVGYSWVGLHTDGFSFQMPVQAALARSGLLTLFGGVSVWLLSWWAHALAHRFGATPNADAALAALAHAVTPLGVWAVLLVWPGFSPWWPLALLWSALLLHLGLSALMQPALRRRVPYTGAVLLGAVVLWLLLGLLRSCGAPWPVLPLDVAMNRSLPNAPTASANAKGAGQRVEREAAGAGAGERTPGTVGQPGASGNLDLPAGKAASEPQDEPLKGVLNGDNTPPTRSVLERFLPGEREGMRRQMEPSWAYHNPTAGVAQYLATGAEAKVSYRGLGDPGQYLVITLTDMTAEKGPVLTDRLLSEITATGGQKSLEAGKASREVEILGERMRVTEYAPARQEGSVELYLAQRYRVRVAARPITLQALYTELERIDLAELERRAQAKRPVE